MIWGVFTHHLRKHPSRYFHLKTPQTKLFSPPADARIGIRPSRLWFQFLDLMTEFQAKSRSFRIKLLGSLGWTGKWAIWILGKRFLCVFCLCLWKATAIKLGDWEEIGENSGKCDSEETGEKSVVFWRVLKICAFWRGEFQNLIYSRLEDSMPMADGCFVVFGVDHRRTVEKRITKTTKLN